MSIVRPLVGYRYDVDTKLNVHVCPTCGITYAIPDRMDDDAREHSRAAPGETRGWYCPNGHSLSYPGENREQELERKLELQRDRAGRLAHERDQERARRIAQKGATTRAKKRSAAGVCPYCKRSFKQVREHVQRMHLDCKPEAKVDA